MAHYSEKDKKGYLKYKKAADKKGQKAQTFGEWLVRKTLPGMKYGETAKDVYKLSKTSKRNRRKNWED